MAAFPTFHEFKRQPHGQHHRRHRLLPDAHRRLRFDKNQRQDPVWGLIFEGVAPVRRWNDQLDLMFLIYTDHITSFFFNHCPAFALGLGGSGR